MTRLANTFLVLTVLLPCTAGSQQIGSKPAWKSVEVAAARNVILSSITFSGDRTGWIVAGHNLLLRTTDSGRTWLPLNSNLSSADTDISRVWFADEQQGWAAGERQHRPCIWKTSNGGNSWSLQSDWPRSSPDSLGGILDIQFVDHSRGWAVGFNGLDALILNTQDGGQHWSVQYFGREITGEFRRIRFNDSLQGWAISNDAVMQTEDGGRFWKLRYFGSGTLNAIDLISATDVWLAGAWGHLLRTHNGIKWSEVRVTPDMAESYLAYVKFTTDGIGWAWGTKCDIAVTHDFGKTWFPEPCPIQDPLRSEVNTGEMAATSSDLFMIANPGRLLIRSIKR